MSDDLESQLARLNSVRRTPPDVRQRIRAKALSQAGEATWMALEAPHPATSERPRNHRRFAFALAAASVVAVALAVLSNTPDERLLGGTFPSTQSELACLDLRPQGTYNCLAGTRPSTCGRTRVDGFAMPLYWSSANSKRTVSWTPTSHGTASRPDSDRPTSTPRQVTSPARTRESSPRAARSVRSSPPQMHPWSHPASQD